MPQQQGGQVVCGDVGCKACMWLQYLRPHYYLRHILRERVLFLATERTDHSIPLMTFETRKCLLDLKYDSRE